MPNVKRAIPIAIMTFALAVRFCPAGTAANGVKPRRPGIWELVRKYAAQRPAAANPLLAERVVHFPSDRSLGKLMIQDENAKRNIGSFFYWTESGDSEWDYLGQAQGSVTVPAGKRLVLYVSQDAWRDLSPLSNLKPDDLYMLSIYGPYQGGALPDDTCMPYIAHLTGLKVLKLENTRISAKGVQSLKHLKNLERLALSKRATDEALAELAELPLLKALYLKEHRLTNTGFTHLQKLYALEELSLGQGRMTDAGLAHLATLPRLRYLLLQGNNFTDAGTVHLKNIPSLKILHLGHLPGLTNAALVHLSEIPNLERLSLHWNENITDNGIAHLKKLPSLKALDIGHARITDKALADLAAIGSLDYLHLPNRGFTDESLAYIAKSDKLKYLWICGSSNSPLTDEALKHVAKLQLLERLHIAGTGFTDTGMREIAKLPSLKDLNLSAFANVTNKGLRELAGLKSLKKLSIHDRGEKTTISGLSCLNAMPGLVELHAKGIVQDFSGLDISGLTNLEKLTLTLKAKRVGKSIVRDMFRDEDMACLAQLKKLKWLQGINGISDIGLKHLSGLTNMERLGIAGPNLTDAALVHLANMQKLNHLYIGDGNITDAGLAHLEGLRALGYLNITSRSRISAAAKYRLRKALPNLAFFQTQLKQASPARRDRGN